MSDTVKLPNLFECCKNHTENGVVFVYLLKTNSYEFSNRHMMSFLTEEEVVRRKSVKKSDMLRRTVSARVLLRRVLSECLGIPPLDIVIDEGEGRKPRVMGGGIDFNVSKTDGFVGVALMKGQKIGFDLEKVRPFPDLQKFVERFFHKKEQQWIFRDGDIDQQNLRFFDVWTRKEAYLKALGVGLERELDEFSVISRNEVSIGEPQQVIDSGQSLYTHRPCALSGVSVSLALEKTPNSVRVIEVPPQVLFS